MSFRVESVGKNLSAGRFSHFAAHRLAHGFSARTGGVSTGDFSSLNMGLHVGDEKECVIENRRRFLGALGLSLENTVSPRQVHGDRVLRVGADERGLGAFDYASAPEADALITNETGLALLLCFADCVPLILFDPVRRALGVAHAGWKGTVAKIGAKTVREMEREFGSRPEDILVGIGPSIGPECFEVGGEVAEKFEAAFPREEAQLINSEGVKPHINLWEANRLALLEAGLLDEHIECAEVCTVCHRESFFSYRGDGAGTGRLAAVAALR